MKNKTSGITIVFGLFWIAWGSLVIKGVVPHARGCNDGIICIILAFGIVLLEQLFLIDYRFYNNEIDKIRAHKISFTEAICTTLSIYGIFGIFMYIMDTFNSKADILFIASLALILVCGFSGDQTEFKGDADESQPK